MPIDPDTLASLASDYAQGMTPIRSRRVQRLLEREFAGADHVLRVQVDGRAGVLGVSQAGAALCATDGRGPHAAILRWLHGGTEVFETRYDLLKDSLPVVDSTCVPMAGARGDEVQVATGDVPPAAQALVAMAVQALGKPGAGAQGEVEETSQ